MNIQYLIQLMENRLQALILAKDQAFSAGDLERIVAIDNEMLGVQDTLFKLGVLVEATLTAASANASFSAVMTAGAEAVKNSVTNSDGALSLDIFDITSYATDPLHEQKIRDILSRMPQLINPETIQAYLQAAAPGSPVTGQMVFDAAIKYGVDIRLVVALMELDSMFGTLGIGATTFNPGNVGNTGTAIRTYASWAEGVEAVAEWLSRHRKIAVTPTVPPPMPVSDLPIIPVEPVIPPPTPPEVPPIIPPVEPEILPEIKPNEDPIPTAEPSTEPLSANLKARGKRRFFRRQA